MKIKEKFKSETDLVKYVEKTFGISLSKTKAKEILKEIADQPFSLTGLLKVVKGK
jgi:uncharacterized protein (DUF697 family)